MTPQQFKIGTPHYRYNVLLVIGATDNIFKDIFDNYKLVCIIVKEKFIQIDFRYFIETNS